MAIFKCIGCGKELVSDDSNAFCICVYCGTRQPVPQAGSEYLQQHPNPEGANQTAVPGSTNVQTVLDRGFIALEDGEWDKADGFFEQALYSDARLANAYLGKLMAELKVRRQEDLKDCAQPFDNSVNYQRVLRFDDTALVKTLKGYNSRIIMRNENDRQISIYNNAGRMLESAKTEKDYKDAAGAFSLIPNYKDAGYLAKVCLEKAEECRKDAVWTYANSLMTGDRIAAYETAIQSFRTIPGWRDADTKIGACRQIIDGLKAKEEADRIQTEKRKKKFLKTAIILLSTAAVCAVACIFLMKAFFPKAVACKSISAEYRFTVGLKEDGTVVAIGDNSFGQCSVGDWKDIVAVSTGYGHTVGLKADGTVVAVGYNGIGQCDVKDWTHIVAISASSHHTVGLKKDGTVVAIGDNSAGQCDVDGWKNIVAVSAGGWHTVGLKKDGTVVAVGRNVQGQCDVDGWKDIVAVSAGSNHTVGLKKDGTVVAVGYSGVGQCDVISSWKNIVAVSAGSNHTVGLKKDGTVVAVGRNVQGQCDVDDWKDIVAVSAGYDHIVGLKKNGTVVAVGNNDSGQCNVENWEDIKRPD